MIDDSCFIPFPILPIDDSDEVILHLLLRDLSSGSTGNLSTVGWLSH